MRAWICFAALAWSAAAQAVDACPESGKGFYFACSSCHWQDGEGNEAFGAPALAGLSEAYLAQQLGNYQLGRRGTHPDDALGGQMAFLARTLRDDEAVRAVSCYIAGLPAAPPRPTLAGDPQRGMELYASCAGCHGERAEGNPAVLGPALAPQSDWYLRAQLEAYRAGWRGTHPEDQPGRQMRSAMSALPDEDRAILDVVAYVMSLR